MKQNFWKKLACIGLSLVMTLSVVGCTATQPSQEDALPSWSDSSQTKQDIIQFVGNVTEENGENYVPPEDRVAVFDMDGTLVCEKLWMQFAEAIDLAEEKFADDPEITALKDEAVALAKEDEGMVGSLDKDNELARAVFEGMTQEELVNYTKEYLKNPKPGFEGVTYADTFYKPMVELLDYLKQNQFEVYIVSGSERCVIWSMCEDVLDLPREHMIGVDTQQYPSGMGEQDEDVYLYDADDTLTRSTEVTQKSLRMDKVYNISNQIGRQPIMAVGNSSDDFDMLNYAKANDEYQSLAILLKHDDGEREYQYNIKPEWDQTAQEQGWDVVSMRDEFEKMFLKDATKTQQGNLL